MRAAILSKLWAISSRMARDTAWSRRAHRARAPVHRQHQGMHRDRRRACVLPPSTDTIHMPDENLFTGTDTLGRSEIVARRRGARSHSLDIG